MIDFSKLKTVLFILDACAHPCRTKEKIQQHVTKMTRSAEVRVLRSANMLISYRLRQLDAPDKPKMPVGRSSIEIE